MKALEVAYEIANIAATITVVLFVLAICAVFGG